MTHRHFARGTTVFTCQICQRRTRITTGYDTRFCGECYELLGIQNGLWDNGEAYFIEWGGIAERDNLLKKITKLGGNIEKVKAQMTDLFAVEAA
jgi:hypothetical protein